MKARSVVRRDRQSGGRLQPAAFPDLHGKAGQHRVAQCADDVRRIGGTAHRDADSHAPDAGGRELGDVAW